jgi:hypothetical protein
VTSPGELHCDIGEREENMVQVLLGRSGTQEDAELMLQTLVVEVEGPTNPGDAILRGAQPHSLERPDNGVEVGGAGGADRSMNLLQSPSYGDNDV